MKIAVGADHRGHALKEKIVVLLNEQGHQVVDMGTNSAKSCDYPDLAFPVAKAVSSAAVDCAILICGNGIGMSICANKVPGVRAALCHDELTAEMSRRHNHTNILCLASDVLGEELVRRIVSNWLQTDYDVNGRHKRRVNKVMWIERGCDPKNYVPEEGEQDNTIP